MTHTSCYSASTSYWLLVSYVAVTAFLKLLSHSIFGTSGLRTLAAYGLYSWIAVIPLALLFVGVTSKREPKVRSFIQRVGRGLTSTLLVACWLYGLTLGLWTMMIKESWPLSLRHGPDTEYALDGFNRLAGFAAPASVTDIYYKSLGVMELHDDLRFQVTDPAVVERLVKHLELVDSETLASDHHPMFGAQCLRHKLQHPHLKCYYRRSGRAHWYVRYDAQTQAVHYEMISP